MDGPPAMSLGVDPVDPDAMKRPPRAVGERILGTGRLVRILLASAVMAAGTLAVLTWAPGPQAKPGEATVAGTMAFVTFVFFQVFNLLNVRHDTRSVFSHETLQNTSAFVATAAVLVLLVVIVETDSLHGLFTTTGLTAGQWLAYVAVGSAILWTGEALKSALRSRACRGGAGPRGGRRPGTGRDVGTGRADPRGGTDRRIRQEDGTGDGPRGVPHRSSPSRLRRGHRARSRVPGRRRPLGSGPSWPPCPSRPPSDAAGHGQVQRSAATRRRRDQPQP
ncbi:cation-translocating P-type ATPase C-terminal domain-containing protein, partial [Streptomyces zhihengii]|uniref:cation-translocating P-type ATPase C-terminal domain-containing protein n=1 Tax=Streptomyces zhihengii TaxID=1818004 RepID=UPI0033B26A1E